MGVLSLLFLPVHCRAGGRTPGWGEGGAHDAQGPHVACGWKKFGSFLMLSKDF